MKISACWLLHRLIKFNKICWEKRPAKPRPNLRTSFCRCDLKNAQPHLNLSWHVLLLLKMCLGGGVPLIGPQEELRSPSGYTPRGFLEPRVGGEVRIFGLYNNKQKNERMKRRYKPNISALHAPEERLPSGAQKEEFGRLDCLFACIYESVSCVCFLLYLSFYLCCARYVFCVLFYIHNHLFVLFFPFQVYKFNWHLCHGAYWCTHTPAHMPMLLFQLHVHLSNSSYVCLKMYTHFPPLPYSYTLIAIFISINVWTIL